MKTDTGIKIIFGLSGLVGGLIAIIADVCQKGDNSSFQKMSRFSQPGSAFPSACRSLLLSCSVSPRFFPLSSIEKIKPSPSIPAPVYWPL